MIVLSTRDGSTNVSLVPLFAFQWRLHPFNSAGSQRGRRWDLRALGSQCGPRQAQQRAACGRGAAEPTHTYSASGNSLFLFSPSQEFPAIRLQKTQRTLSSPGPSRSDPQRTDSFWRPGRIGLVGNLFFLRGNLVGSRNVLRVQGDLLIDLVNDVAELAVLRLLPPLPKPHTCVHARVRACVRARARACVRVHARVRARACVRTQCSCCGNSTAALLPCGKSTWPSCHARYLA